MNKNENTFNNKVKINFIFFVVGGFMKVLDRIALALIIIGGINWGSIGIFGFDIVGAIFGGQDALFSRIIFTVVGLAAIWCLSLFFRERDMLD